MLGWETGWGLNGLHVSTGVRVFASLMGSGLDRYLSSFMPGMNGLMGILSVGTLGMRACGFVVRRIDFLSTT